MSNLANFKISYDNKSPSTVSQKYTTSAQRIRPPLHPCLLESSEMASLKIKYSFWKFMKVYVKFHSCHLICLHIKKKNFIFINFIFFYLIFFSAKKALMNNSELVISKSLKIQYNLELVIFLDHLLSVSCDAVRQHNKF